MGKFQLNLASKTKTARNCESQKTTRETTKTSAMISSISYSLVGFSSLVLASLLLFACSEHSSVTPTSGGTQSAQSIDAPDAISVAVATSAQCPAGGYNYTIYADNNQNGVLDSSDTILANQIVCNGTNGSDGYTTLFSLNRVTADADTCASLSGLQISSGLDLDRSGTLDPSEITQVQIVCDGQNGAQGTAGAAGSNGHSMVFQTASAGLAICPNGGSIIMMALDTSDTGIYNADLPDQQSVTLCNGANGTNGTNGTNATPSAYTAVEPIMPCGDTVAEKEVLLRLGDGQVLAAFSDSAAGAETRLTLIPDGSYVDTDDSNCNFTLSTSTDGTTRSISWFNTVQESWPLTND